MNAIDIQMFGGMALLALLLWQLATGMRWIKLGKINYKVHKWTGVSLVVLGIPHLVNAMRIAGWVKF